MDQSHSRHSQSNQEEQLPDNMRLSGSKKQQPWMRWKVLAIAGASLAVPAVGLSVGLGVGLTQRSGHGGSSGSVSSLPSGSSSQASVWQPSVNATWQIILSGNPKIVSGTAPNPDVSIYDLDLFTNDASTFKALQNDGKKVICYFSAGSYEPDRPDSSKFQSSDLGKVLDGWPNEKWLKLSSPNVRSIMSARVKTAAQKGCNAIDPDNVDGYVSRLLLNMPMRFKNKT